MGREKTNERPLVQWRRVEASSERVSLKKGEEKLRPRTQEVTSWRALSVDASSP